MLGLFHASRLGLFSPAFELCVQLAWFANRFVEWVYSLGFDERFLVHFAHVFFLFFIIFCKALIHVLSPLIFCMRTSISMQRGSVSESSIFQ